MIPFNGLTGSSSCREDTSLLHLRTMGCVIDVVKGFVAVPYYNHRLRHLGYIRRVRPSGATWALHCWFITPLMATFPYQTSNNNDALVPAADIA